MTDKQMPDTKPYRVTAVGAIYQKPAQTLGPDGDLTVALTPTLGTRSEIIELVPFEAQRLEGLGAVKAVDEPRSYDEMGDDELDAEIRSRALDVRGSAVDGSVRREDRINALLVFDQGATAATVVGTTTVPGGIAESRPGTSDTARVQTGVNAPTAPDPLTASTDDLAQYIQEGPEGKKLTAEETVALAQGDPARAEKVLDAERQALKGDPRTTVEERLKRLADSGDDE